MFNHFDLFGQQIHLYNIFLCLGLIAGALELERRIIQNKVPGKATGKIRLIAAVSIPLGIFSAYIFDLAVTQGTFDLSFTGGGLTFLGGLLGGILIVSLLSLLMKVSLPLLLNLAATSIVSGHVLGRVGCFFAGCCFGKSTSCFLGVSFPKGSLPYEALGNVRLHPTQLYEALGLVVLYCILIRLNLTIRFFAYLAGYGLIRFLIEYLRADERGAIPGFEMLSPSQVISALFMVVGVGGMLIKGPGISYIRRKELR